MSRMTSAILFQLSTGESKMRVLQDSNTPLQSTDHEGFACNLTDLWINPLYPHLGVSPDGVNTCSCCGDGWLEIKCPCSARHASSLNNETCCFLTDTGYLNQKHRYYTQVQGQFMVRPIILWLFHLDSYWIQTWVNTSWCALLGETRKTADIISCR